MPTKMSFGMGMEEQQQRSAEGYTPEAEAWFARMSSQPSNSWKKAANVLMEALLAEPTIYDNIKLWIFAVEALGQELPCMTDGFLSLTEHGTVTLTPSSGIAGNGTTGYYDTGFSMTNGMETAFSMGAFITASSDAMSVLGTVGVANALVMLTKGSGVNALTRIAMGTNNQWANTVGEGHFCSVRSGTTVRGYQDSIMKASTATGATVNPAGNNICFMRRTTTFSVARFGAGWFAHTAFTDAQIVSIDDALRTFLASI